MYDDGGGGGCVGDYLNHYCVSFLLGMELAVSVSPQLLHMMGVFLV